MFFFRCLSHESEHRVILRGLDPRANYSGTFYSGQVAGAYTGEQLMSQGIACRLERTLMADVLILRSD